MLRSSVVVLIVDRDRLVILDSHTVVFAHGLDCLDEVGGYLAGEAHEEVVFVSNHATLKQQASVIAPDSERSGARR